MYVLFSFIQKTNLRSMREKTEPIKYIFRSRDEIQANVTVLQLLHIANLKLAEHERLKSLYEKKTPRPWKISAYWIKNEDHRMIPLLCSSPYIGPIWASNVQSDDEIYFEVTN